MGDGMSRHVDYQAMHARAEVTKHWQCKHCVQVRATVIRSSDPLFFVAVIAFVLLL